MRTQFTRAHAAHPATGLPVTTTSSLAERIEVRVWWVCVVILGMWAVGYVGWPFSNDQGNLAWVGDVIRSGGMPYRDAWDVKGPAAHLLFAAAGALFGRNEWGLRVFDLLFLLAGALAVRRIVGRYMGDGSGQWAVIIYLLWYASLNHHNTAQPDGWAAVLLSCAVALLVTARNRPSPLAGAGAGALIATCALIKPTYAAFLALPMLEGAMHFGTVPQVRVVRVVRFWVAVALGFVLPVVACVGWFAARGALADWVDVHVRWIPTAYTQLDAAWPSRVQYLILFFTADRFAPAVPLAIGGVIAIRGSRYGRDAVLIGAWAGIALLCVLVQGQFYVYHWLALYPPLAVLAGIGVHGLFMQWRTRGATWAARSGTTPTPVAAVVAVAAAAVLVLGAAIGPGLHIYRWAKFATGLGDASAYDRAEFGPYGHHGGVFAELVEYLRAHSMPSDMVVMWGSNAGINYLSGRASPSPFAYVQPLVDPPDSELRRTYRAEFMQRLVTRAPLYVVSLNEAVCERGPSADERKLMGAAEGVVRCLNDIPAVHDYVLGRYAVEQTIGPLEVRRRR